MTEEAYPLQWPVGRPRTQRPESSRFNVTFAAARDALMHELHLMGARYPVLSTNCELKRDGMPYANQKEPEDKGVAVYFERKGRAMAFSCDRWNKTKDNVQAIRHTISALRGLDRWGTGDAIDAAFTGFQALPPPSEKTWRDILGDCSTIEEAKSRRNKLLNDYHPDRGGLKGSDTVSADINVAFEQAKKELE